MDDEHEGTLNPLSQDENTGQDGGIDQNDDGELDITREETDFTELANARAKEAMDQLENMRFANREARRKRKEAWEKEHQGTIHLSDTVDVDPEMMREAEQKYDQFGQPIGGVPIDGQMPMGGVVDPMQPVQSMNGQIPSGPMPMQPMSGQMNGAGSPQMGVVTNLDGTVPIASLDPTSRPMKQIPTVVVQKPKKIRKGWLVAVSVSAFIAIALAVLAVLIVANNKPDTVAKAFENIAVNGLAENIAVNGEVDFEFKDAAIDTLTANLEGELKTKTLENSVAAKLIAEMEGGDKLGVEASEIYAKNSGVYLKLNKAGALIKEIKNEDEIWELITSIVAKTDGKWVRINSDEADTAKLGDAKGGTCEAEMMKNLAANQSTIAAIYRTYPFISSTTKGIELEQVENPVYKINLDLNNLTSFFNGVETMKTLSAYEECKGLVQPAIVGSKVAEIFEKMRNIYVEVSEDYIITRVYFEYVADWGEMAADLYLSYPETVRIEAPEDYIDLSQILKTT